MKDTTEVIGEECTQILFYHQTFGKKYTIIYSPTVKKINKTGRVLLFRVRTFDISHGVCS